MNFNTKLMNEPKAYQITVRLNQLRAVYGKQYVHDCIFYGDTHYNPEMGRHVDNLMLTFGSKLVLEIAEIMLVSKKVG